MCVCVCVCVCMYTLCFYSKLVEYDIVVDGLLMNSHLNDVVVVMRCCCWWLKPWVIIIIELWCEFVSFLKVLQKWVKWWFVMDPCFDSSFIWIWVPFYVYKRLDKPWEQIWALGIQNWGFGVKNRVLPESWLSKLAMASKLVAMASEETVQLAMASEWWPWRVAQYNNSCFCRFRVLGSIRTIINWFFWCN